MAGAPSRLGPYQILGALGAGGMGEVYRAKDTRLQREVAVKILHASAASDPERHRRFAQEAIAASALNHPNILAVYDVGVEGETPYLVSELIDGTSLREDMGRGRAPLKRVLDLGLQIAEGLAAAHGAGIVHRDLKPENVMITRDGRVKILDFGLAKMKAADEDEHLGPSDLTLTADGLLIGTVPYMSPEQARGGRLDFRSDQFSLGVMMNELVTGAHPFRRETAVQTLSAIIDDDAPDLAQSNPTLPVPLRWVLERLLAKDPRERYAHTTDLARDLRTIRDRLPEIAPASGQLVRATSPRLLLSWAAGALALLAGSFGAGWLAAPMGVDLTEYRLTPLATDAGYQGAPAFSPDGKTIAYVAEIQGVSQVFTRTLGAPARSQHTHSRFDCQDPFWDNAGTHIYYLTRAGYTEALFKVSVAGGAPEKLVDHVARASMAPDGRTVALIRTMPEAAAGRMTLWFASPPEAEPKRYTKPPIGDLEFDDAYPRFSPDGSKLLLWLFDDWSDAKPRATGFWQMTPPPNGPLQPVLPALAGIRVPPFFAWFPDNRRIVMVRNDGRTPGFHLWVVDTMTQASRPLTVTNENEGSPAVAPDGRIAHTSESTDFDLVQIPVDGSAPKTVLSSTRNELDPAWSPTRPEFAYVTDRSGAPEIWLRSDDTERELPLVTKANFDGAPTIAMGSLALSPDGQRLAFQRLSTEGYRIWIATISGAPLVQLTAAGYEDAPTWSPDGDWIAFVSGQKLSKVRVGSGSNAAMVLTEGTSDSFPRPRWSPDNRWILWRTNDGLTVIGSDRKESRVISEDEWLAYEWSTDSKSVYGIQPTEDLHHMMLVALDVASGQERVINANLGPIPKANQPIRGFSRMKNGAFLTSMARVRSDIWLMDGFQPLDLFHRVWPFSRPAFPPSGR